VLALALLAAPCVSSAPLDAGQVAECDGVLISAARARQAVADKREVNILRTFDCDPCPDCPDLPKDDSVKIASASFVSGFVLGLLLLVMR